MSGRRTYSRVALPGKVHIVCNETVREAHLADISLLGALVDCSNQGLVAAGQTCEMRLFPETGNKSPLLFSCEIAHVTEGRIGLKFTTVDISTINRLRVLLEESTGNKEAIDREMSQWLNQ